MTIDKRVAALRSWLNGLAAQGMAIDAYVVPTADPHNDEYIPSHYMCREWLSGFTGSAGVAVVTAADARLWTDSRYFLQAEDELKGTPFTLMREGERNVPSVTQWLKEAGVKRVAAPADMLTVSTAKEWMENGMEVVAVPDAFDTIWTERPALPNGTIDVHPLQFAGESVESKLSRLTQHLQQREDAEGAYLFNDLADLAWLLNLRGADIPYNPVFLAYFLVDLKGENPYTLFTHCETLTTEAAAQLQKAGVCCKPYAEAVDAAKNLGKRLHIDPSLATLTLCNGEEQHFCSPIEQWRAVKNLAEREGFRQAMLRDGVALVKFHRWLDERMAHGEEVTELSVDEKLTALRAEGEGFKELSFGTIAACGAHGAIVHYEADAKSSVRLPQHGLLLLDSGAQYDCGTTDITRTVALGNLTAEERRVYTLVLKGHLRLMRMHFPEGTTGLQLDLAVRQDMWAAGYDFGHGTGHGVGAHLCVHEGPHQIRKNVRDCTLVPFCEGMTITDEPGIYVPGKFGVRIENTLICVADKETDFGRFLKFESLTLCPYDLRPVDRSLLTPVEVEQINNYHLMVRRRLMPLLTDEADKVWLARTTSAIEWMTTEY